MAAARHARPEDRGLWRLLALGLRRPPGTSRGLWESLEASGGEATTTAGYAKHALGLELAVSSGEAVVAEFLKRCGEG